MATPKNNLSDVLRRSQELACSTLPVPTIPYQTNQKISKFKPPSAAASPTTVRQPHTGCLSFSTPGFRNTKDPISAASVTSSSISSSVPSKRSSSDPPTITAPSVLPVKRTKVHHSNEKENLRGSSISAVPQSFDASSTIVLRKPALAKTKFVDPIDIDDDLPVPARPAIDFHEDTLDNLQYRIDENSRLRDFLEGLLRNGCRDENHMQNYLESCLARIYALEIQQSRVRRQVSMKSSSAHSSKVTPALSRNMPQPHHMSVTRDSEDDEVWRMFDEVPDIYLNDKVPTTSSKSTSKSAVTDLQASSPYGAEALRVLNTVFSLPSFRHHQFEAIHATMDKKDVFVLMPTGGGKSICYQVPAVCKSGKTKGVTFIISPLIALMTDQVDSLKKKGVDAVKVSSEMSQEEYFQIRDRLLGTGEKPSMVYVAPERLQGNDTFNGWLQSLYSNGQLARFVIDEAHCISTWGRDFRDAYKELARLRQNFPDVPIMALTATANQQVRDDVTNRLGINGCLLLQQSFNRPNLYYEVCQKKRTVVSDIAAWIRAKHAGHSGVIYARTRRDCEKVAEELRDKHGLSAEFYHSEMDQNLKKRRLTDWLCGVCKIMVATIAFGMGVDKPDVRFVIHHTLPRSIDAYYQETGRAGRDGRPADCILYFSHGDVVSLTRLIQNDDIAQSERRRQIDALNEVDKFCFNATDCRRRQLLQHFDEDFDPLNCRNLCDVCRNDEQVVEEDVTSAALDMLHLAEDLCAGGDQITKGTFLSVYIGSRAKDIRDRGYEKKGLFGAGKGMPKEKMDRLYRHLHYEKGLAYNTVQGKEWTRQYLTLGPSAQQFFRGRSLKMKFKLGSVRVSKPSSSRRTVVQGQSRAIKATASVARIPDAIDDFDELYVDDSVNDLDGEDDIEMSPPPKPQLSSKKPKSFSSVVPRNDAPIQCLEELKQVRSSIAKESGYDDPMDLIGDDALEMLSLVDVEDLDQLKSVFSEFDVDKKKTLKLCGTRFLVVCQKHHFRKLRN